MSRWLVMLYLAGADDLEPFMARAVLALEQEGPPEGMEIVVQIARSPLERIKQILPGAGPTEIDGDWSGVRRYRIRKAVGDAPRFESERLPDPQAGCVADPRALAEFVDFATRRFPAERSLLVISGHGMGFVGLTLDLMDSPTPAVLSIRGAAAALRRLKRGPDILLLDACQMNALEVACQFALPRPAARFLITPASLAPRAGLDYPAMVRTLATHASEETGRVAAGIAMALEPLAKVQVLAFALDPSQWRAVISAARGANQAVHPPMFQAAAATCLHPPAGQRLKLLVHWPTSLTFPLRYHYLYHRLRFARLSGWRRLLPKAEPGSLARQSMAPQLAPAPLLWSWIRLLRSDLSDGALAELMERLGWSNQ